MCRLGASTHCLLYVLPTYRQKLKSTKPIVKPVKDGQLMHSWNLFEAAATDLDELINTVTSSTSFCEDLCVPTKTFCTYNNNKPWFSAKLKQLHQAKKEAHRSRDRVLCNQEVLDQKAGGQLSIGNEYILVQV